MNQKEETNMQNLEEQLAGVKTAAIAGHVKPDGDCAGSCLAVYNYMKEYHPWIDVKLYMEPIPDVFNFLSRSDEIISDAPDMRSLDLFLVLDCGDAGRLGKAEGLLGHAGRIVCIDHHISNTGFGDDNYIDPDASSTSELVFDLLPKERITKQIAECIYVGIVHDTGIFQYSCTSSKTMRAAGFLMDTGIDFTTIVDKTYVEKTFAQNRILARAIEKSRLHLDGVCISSIITSEDMKACSVLPKDMEGIVSQLRSTKGVEAAVLFYPKQYPAAECAEEYKISLRSSSDAVNVAEIAMHFQGGGHLRAAGASTLLPPEECLEQIIKQIRRQLQNCAE